MNSCTKVICTIYVLMQSGQWKTKIQLFYSEKLLQFQFTLVK